MKFLTVFVALLSVAFGYQASWTLNQLEQAISNPATDPSLVPYLEQALNQMMTAIFDGQQISAVSVSIPAVDLSTWSLPQLTAAIENPTTDSALLPYLEQALNQVMEAMVSEVPVAIAPVVIPAMDISAWSLAELDAILSNPTTNPELVPYLESALNEIMEAMFSGQQIESVVVAIPAGLLPVENPIVSIPAIPVVPVEAPVAPVINPVPVAPTTPEAPATPASPLVQIIVNVKQQAASIAPTPVAAAE